MPYKDPKNPKNVSYRKRYYEENKDTMWSYERRKESHEKYRKSTKGKESNRRARANRIEAFREYNRDYYNENKPILNTKSRKKTELLTDGYMRKHLLKLGYTRQDIKKYPELVETHRLIIKIKRYEKHQGTS